MFILPIATLLNSLILTSPMPTTLLTSNPIHEFLVGDYCHFGFETSSEDITIKEIFEDDDDVRFDLDLRDVREYDYAFVHDFITIDFDYHSLPSTNQSTILVSSNYQFNYDVWIQISIDNTYQSSRLVPYATSNGISYVLPINDNIITDTYHFEIAFYFVYVPSDIVDSFTNAYQDGYDYGYLNGVDVGKDEGYDMGYDTGHSIGFNEGVSSAHNYTFTSLFGAIADTPIIIIRKMLGFEVFGIQLYSILFSMIAGVIALYVIRKII